MEMMIVVRASCTQNPDGAEVTSEVSPTVPGPHQSVWGGAAQIKNCQVFPKWKVGGVSLSLLHVDSTFDSSLGFIS